MSPPSPQPTLLRRWQQSGILWAILSPLFLGVIPIFAKLAYRAGVDIYSVVAIRTVFATLLLWSMVLILNPRSIESSTPATFSSLLAGSINGLGSIFFYASLTRINASLGQLINITYLIFVTILLRLIGQRISWVTVGRTVLAIAGIYLLTAGGVGTPDWVGISFMLVAAISYAIQLVLSQRILYEIPAVTMTLYAITGMSLVVILPWLLVGQSLFKISVAGWEAVLLMGLATALSRLTLFLGVKKLGSIQTALFGVAEVVVTIVIAAIFLEEHFTWQQWVGALVILVSILLVNFERDVPRLVDWWRFIWKRQVG
ncbi:MAG: DMT family transporter [Chloroflexi bacterium]|nr:DMT family transporter [Chloroflexota bacterium]MBP8058772.1 DMT family transporter [Chloroflexota bacterium]